MATNLPSMCPYCSSSSVQAVHRRFNFLGFLLFGWWSVLFGEGKIIVTCLSCGKQWKPDEAQKIVRSIARRRFVGKFAKVSVWIVMLCLVALIGFMYWFAWRL